VFRVGGKDAEFLVDPGAPALRTGHRGVGMHQKLEIASAGRAFVFEYGHFPLFLTTPQIEALSEGTYHRQQNNVKLSFRSRFYTQG
jgi:hypothetical protein